MQLSDNAVRELNSAIIEDDVYNNNYYHHGVSIKDTSSYYCFQSVRQNKLTGLQCLVLIRGFEVILK